MKLQQAMEQVRARLDQLNPRERRLVTWGSALTGAVLLWTVGLDPAIQTLKSAPGQQQALQAKAAEVMRAASELEALRGARSRVVVRDSELEPRLAQLLVDQTLQQQTTLRRTEEGELRIEFTEAPAAAVLAWLSKAESIASLTLLEAELNKVAAATLTGHVVFLPKAGNAP
ncbi:type II secretion system protein M [Limnobacter humi]|uniref:Type II secretion system protein M n=1 Tax=Limnobacter humi TaxID=1778671 RepID=A0ABT1WJF3_9BURK|nr:type II secretion system protein GspM [Limnobacter humi]MCQ8897634.1 type II secretion system protein M [Limnobacter humi]